MSFINFKITKVCNLLGYFIKLKSRINFVRTLPFPFRIKRDDFTYSRFLPNKFQVVLAISWKWPKHITNRIWVALSANQIIPQGSEFKHLRTFHFEMFIFEQVLEVTITIHSQTKLIPRSVHNIITSSKNLF